MSDNQQQPNETAELEADAASILGVRPSPEQPESEPAESQPEVPEQATESAPKDSPEKPQAEPEKEPAKPDGQSLPPEIQEVLKETPYKDFRELVKGYKEVQGQWTKDRQEIERVKPLRPLIDRAISDPRFAEALRMAEQVYNDPQRFIPVQPPDPTKYDLYDPASKAEYDKQVIEFARQVARQESERTLSTVQQRNQVSEWKSDFLNRFKDFQGDPDELMQWGAQSAQTTNPLEIAYKLRNWDSREAAITERVRRELTTKLEQAQQTKTPQAASNQSQTITESDVLRYIDRYGAAAAEKKFGKELFWRAMNSEADVMLR